MSQATQIKRLCNAAAHGTTSSSFQAHGARCFVPLAWTAAPGPEQTRRTDRTREHQGLIGQVAAEVQQGATANG